jgi:hypothetical protein
VHVRQTGFLEVPARGIAGDAQGHGVIPAKIA